MKFNASNFKETVDEGNNCFDSERNLKNIWFLARNWIPGQNIDD